ncbi:sulfatase-like hydrolase/transferase (plasmid) [Halorussus limi]|uniref:Sulfatase-like hydrolase/transferase n=1 Tax=Halorussus limi TaxID=2938695 RepID=A0A8U0HZT0_9EURY|nr:sulfatase-like hydrolase/transferase [Halorussus limi]UPV76642.1 sulfatase-like hydrolase/transferase [Halorussus limi]
MDIRVRNVLIYVADAVRYDAVSEELATLGPTYKTISASTHTPTSFGSLLTGLYPPSNGIISFNHSSPHGIESIFDARNFHVSLAAVGGMNDTIGSIFGGVPRSTINEVEPPFIHVVRRPGGHAPYDGFDMNVYEYKTETAQEYLYNITDDPKKGREDYQNAVQQSLAEFQRNIDILEERNLLDDTLIIFTSDHGELLGEYGYFGHTHLATPEVVYVPTTFIHPDLPVSRGTELLHHVDVLPSIQTVTDDEFDIGRTHGTPFGKGRTMGFNYFEHVTYRYLPDVVKRAAGFFTGRKSLSLWDKDGGHVFVEGSHPRVGVLFLGLLSMTPEGRQILRHDDRLDLLSRFMPGHRIYDSPNFSAETARSKIDRILAEDTDFDTRKLDEGTVSRLRDMGYM